MTTTNDACRAREALVAACRETRTLAEEALVWAEAHGPVFRVASTGVDLATVALDVDGDGGHHAEGVAEVGFEGARPRRSV